MAIRLLRQSSIEICTQQDDNHLPAGAGASNEIENLAWLYCLEAALFPLEIQLIHDSFQYVKGGQASNATAIEGQQAQPCAIKRARLTAPGGRESLFH